jgi:rhodanese-related sulfurtransferase
MIFGRWLHGSRHLRNGAEHRYERIERAEVQRLLDAGGQLVEVLPREEYEHEHLAGAVHIPLRELDERAPRELDPTRPVIVYCNDFL